MHVLLDGGMPATIIRMQVMTSTLDPLAAEVVNLALTFLASTSVTS